MDAETQAARILEVNSQKARPSVSTEALCEEIREQFVQSVTMLTRDMNIGNVEGLTAHLSMARFWTHAMIKITPRIRYQHEIRGFFVQD